jgi:hypothetical protein
VRLAACVATATLLLGAAAAGTGAGAEGRGQAPVASEVRQLVTFTFRPGRSGEAQAIYRDEALPLYASDAAMLSFRAFREVESSIPIDLIIVRGFEGMAGMDESNANLHAPGVGLGAIYGKLGAMTASHTDQFIEMLPALGTGDAASLRLTAFTWYRVAPGQGAAFEQLLESAIVPWEAASDVDSSTGRFLISDGWDYLRMVAFASLSEYEAYRRGLRGMPTHDRFSAMIAAQRQAVVASIPELSIR